MTGITSIVDQLTGRSRIPESAKPIGISSDKPERRPVKPPARVNEEALAKLEAALCDRYESVRAINQRAGVGYHTALHLLPVLVRRGQAVARTVAWRVSVRTEYRRRG